MASLSDKPGYEHSEPFDSGFLAVGTIHRVYYEQYGKKGDKPGNQSALLHGGPGGQTLKLDTAYFDPAVYCVVLFDQRGAGKSTPNAEIRENTTQDLIDDIEALRRHCNIAKWHCILGGSWGSTLILVYVQSYPEPVGSLILRGIFTVRKEEVTWSEKKASALFYSDLFDDLIAYLPTEDKENVLMGYYKPLISEDRETRLAAARSWNTWGISIGSFQKENIDKIRHIPGNILSQESLSCYLLISPNPWPESRLFWISDAGHAASEPGTYHELVEVTDEYAKL
ncbi:proline iminopeptidase [Xylogone sp. PMI_703]|nr:proline iminopeptidase [Xylogone sp. PMI_703]